MNKLTDKKLDKKLVNLANELNEMFTKELRLKRYKINICNNKACLENSGNIVGYLKCKKKDIPVCGFRNLCPDAKLRYFNYLPNFIKKEDKI